MEKPGALIILIGLILALAFASESSQTVAQNTPSASKTGAEIYRTICSSCHGSGLANAPKPGSKEWKKRREAGIQPLLSSAMSGKGVMPRKGSCIECSEDELRLAVAYLTAR